MEYLLNISLVLSEIRSEFLFLKNMFRDLILKYTLQKIKVVLLI